MGEFGVSQRGQRPTAIFFVLCWFILDIYCFMRGYQMDKIQNQRKTEYEQQSDDEILQLIAELETIINERAKKRRTEAAAEIKAIADRAGLDLADLIPKKRGRPKKTTSGKTTSGKT